MIIDEVRYVNCPFCVDGKHMDMVCYGAGQLAREVICKECNGMSVVEEADYLVWKLDGSI